MNHLMMTQTIRPHFDVSSQLGATIILCGCLAMSASLNEPPELAWLLEGTLVCLSLMSGEPLEESLHGLTGTFKVECRTRTSLLAESFAITVCRHLRIPPSCVNFVWGPTYVNEDTEEMRVLVSMQLRPVKDDNEQVLLVDMHTTPDSPECFICQWPCEDADNDVSFGPDGRVRNCAECQPCFLCSACSLRLRDGSSRCLQCISEEELTLVDCVCNDANRLRRRLLVPETCG